ncbi:phospholipase D-like domain-containing protein [Streptomyces griseofuscus]|uniref:phospholipase D-like domain-containing protein n=1 Tax=Streptomyces TaxID=1883 RepID=UPI00081E5E02|nr:MULTISPECIES: phospholipase D-like domain-containing protein [unclassified Streptomyces]MBJ7002668.1 cardiolipin synthase [Streptomyces sp. CRPSP2-6A1]MYQ94858.1 cardiolipin synthase [Streptomyces sp. SID4946]SCF60209.1 Phosphatidylserine/phosphatidylglycerophosphate/cardiolipin synthase [Streptomyces sp. LamerLS-31b]SCF91925.1 Phosphatidylserine/phosphatidylglycerophosphate/cardiolipin synthase [Streptomyces sp. DconLS]
MLRKALTRAAVALAAGSAIAVAAVPANAATYSAFAFSQAGTSQPAIYDFINSATSKLDMTMYELEDTTAVNDLVALEKKGVTVRVVLDRQHKSEDNAAYTTLTNAGVGVVWSSSSYVYTHQKTITVDGTKSLVLTGNLTSQYYTTSRDYGVFTDDSRDVAAIEKVFDADYAGTAITPTDGDHLLWSPTDSRSRLVSFVNAATKTLDVQELEFSDSTVVNAIVARAKAGVKVRVVLEDPASYASEVSAVKAAGGTVVGYSDPNGFYIHAKAMVADYGLSTQAVEAGSMNISSNSLSNNRELGIIMTGTGVAQPVAQTIETTFSSDYAGGTAA